MSTFGSIMKMNIKQQLQYRTAALSGIITQLFFGFMQISLFTAFLVTGANDFTLAQMSTYIWLQQAFFSLFKYWDCCKTEISEKIENGDISYQLIRPMPIYDYWYQTVISKSFGLLALRALPIIVIALLLPEGIGLMLPVSPLNFLLFLVSMCVSAFLVTAINCITYIITLYTLSSKGVSSFMVAIATFLAGAVVPIPMLPDWFANILNFFPFRYVSDLPFRIYMGNINGLDALIQIGIQIAWLIGIVLISKTVMHRKVNKLVVQGG